MLLKRQVWIHEIALFHQATECDSIAVNPAVETEQSFFFFFNHLISLQGVKGIERGSCEIAAKGKNLTVVSKDLDHRKAQFPPKGMIVQKHYIDP